ncbi:methyltransferase [Rivibacter subsaxonicus]|uniref:Hydroxyneurosporene-O-methyltransferase n=1 Tax=Rivibacter subsaxonicus TaxID=457575 RepID=A0A4Q7W0Y0_9BURK|nr:methyltransferase [Rivibacter subsaxonicus]RZU02851.1 hydroxyneurosporene-O-methyltransferase [Rivibacter subsaxonicus]
MKSPQLLHEPVTPADSSALSTWRDRWLLWRDRLVATPGFRRRAAAFVLTRPIARRRSRELFDLVAGFVYSQVLLACVRLRVFELLAEGPQQISTLAPRLGLAPDAALRLLEAAVSLRLVERRANDRFGLGPLGAPMVGNAGLAAMVEHHAALYADLRDPVALLRGETDGAALAAYWPYAGATLPAAVADERVAAYSALMSASQPLVAEQVLAAYDFGRHRCLLDVGGGEGAFIASVAAQAPRLRLMLFDLPAVAARARSALQRQGLQARVEVHGGDFLSDALPQGADLASLVRVIHDHDDARAMAILRAVHRALPVGGTLLLAEPMAGTVGAEPMGAAYFGFYLLAMGRGRPRSQGELRSMLHAAGFGAVRELPTAMPLQTRLLQARVNTASKM